MTAFPLETSLGLPVPSDAPLPRPRNVARPALTAESTSPEQCVPRGLSMTRCPQTLLAGTVTVGIPGSLLGPAQFFWEPRDALRTCGSRPPGCPVTLVTPQARGLRRAPEGVPSQILSPWGLRRVAATAQRAVSGNLVTGCLLVSSTQAAPCPEFPCGPGPPGPRQRQRAGTLAARLWPPRGSCDFPKVLGPSAYRVSSPTSGAGS